MSHLRRFTSLPTGYPGLPPWANFYRAYGAGVAFALKCASCLHFPCVFISLPLVSLRLCFHVLRDSVPQLLKFLEANAWPLALTSLVQFVVFLRWMYRRIRNDELTRAFVEDMATNHLPHIYEMLEKLCDKQGIERDPAPTIRWIDLNDRSN